MVVAGYLGSLGLMATIIGRILATVIVVALALCTFAKLAPIGLLQVLVVCFGWALAYFGDELAPLLGVTTTSSTYQYVEPVVRGIGWFLLLVVLALYIARVIRLR